MNGVFWIKGNPPVRLAIVLCPRGGKRLEDELLRIQQKGIETLVSLLEEEEAVLLDLADESPAAVRIGLECLSYPIPDTHLPPDTASFRSFVSGLADRLRAGEAIGVHCRGSIGRSTVTAACALIHLGWKPEAALVAIQAARGVLVPQTQEQEDWILRYKAKPE
jgi:protein-tyrosine phosphatase